VADWPSGNILDLPTYVMSPNMFEIVGLQKKLGEQDNNFVGSTRRALQRLANKSTALIDLWHNLGREHVAGMLYDQCHTLPILRRHFSSRNLPFPWRDLDYRGSFGYPPSQTASRSSQPFFRNSRSLQRTNGQNEVDISTRPKNDR